jgi:hypothetical protein
VRTFLLLTAFPSLIVLAACGSSRVSQPTGGAGPTGSSSSTGAGGSGGSGLRGACQTSADCMGNPCAPITPGGYLVCLSPVASATSCESGMPPANPCCTSTDCPAGAGCYADSKIKFCGGAFPAFNECIADLCTSDADCATSGAPQICAPAGAFGFPRRACLDAYCHTDADCTAMPGGACVPVGGNPCCSLVIPDGLACMYPGGCGPGAPCSDDDGTCTIDTVSGTSTCGPLMIGCPP